VEAVVVGEAAVEAVTETKIVVLDRID